MKSPTKQISFFALFTLLSACQSANQTATTDSSTKQTTDTSKTISLIHMNDLHAHLIPHLDYDYNNGQPIIRQRGGLARISTAIKQIRNENPDSILLNIGDTYHGGVEAFYSTGNDIVDPVNALNIDIGVPGNWDFAYGPAVTRERFSGQSINFTTTEIKQINYQALAANVTSTTPVEFLPATHTITINGVVFGFIGITSDIVPRMFAGLALGLDFLQGKQNYIDLINAHAAQLREQGANVVIVLSELGIHKDIALADSISINSVDVFFSAHTHELTAAPIKGSSGALVVEAGNDSYLGRMDMHFDAEHKLLMSEWSILTIDDNYAPDSEVALMVEKIRQPYLSAAVNMSIPMPLVNQTLTQPIDTVIGHTNHTLDRRHALENYFNNAFTSMLKQYAGTDIAMAPGFRFDSIIPGSGYLLEDNTIASGNITLEDVYRFFPVTFNLATGTVSGSRLKNIIEENLNAVFSTDSFQHSGGWFDGYAGLELSLNLSGPDNQRIVNISQSNNPVDIADNDLLTVAGCIRPVELDSGNILCSYNGFENVTALINPITNEPWTAIDFLTEQFIQNQLPNTLQQHIHEQSNTPMWPDSEFVQPLRGAK